MWMILLIALILGIFQIYTSAPLLPLGAWWIAAFALPVVVLARRRDYSPLVWVLIALSAFAMFALLWSPNEVETQRAALSYACVIVVALLTARLLRQDPLGLRRALSGAGVAVAGHATLTIVFLLFPAVEASYLTSSIAPTLSGPGVSRIYADLFNNVLYDQKAGGFFLNGNTASVFMGFAAWLYVASGVLLKSKWHFVVAALSITGALFTGSKTSLALGTLTIALSLITYSFVRRSRLALPALLSIAIAVAIGITLFLDAFGEILLDTSETLGSRGRIVELAHRMIEQSPVLGLGFGGWSEAYAQYGGFTGMTVRPAHNFFLQAWLDAGILHFALIICVVAIATAKCARLILKRHDDANSAAVGVALTMAFAWVFIHGQADNTAFYGDIHLLPFFAVGMAILYAPELNAAEPVPANRHKRRADFDYAIHMTAPRPARYK